MMVLFLVFFQIGLFSVGGGYAAMPLIQSLVVESHGWLTMAEFTNLMTIAEMTPGPIAVNSATFVGMRCAGLPGALVATFGCITPSLILVTLLSYLYGRFRSGQTMQNVLGALRPVVVALIASAALSIVQVAAVKSGGGVSIVGIVLMVAAFLVLRWKKWNPILVMLLCGVGGAAAHNCGQVCAALITLGSTAPLYYLPFLLLVSLFTGALSGLITAFLFRAMAHTPYGTKGENQHG